MKYLLILFLFIGCVVTPEEEEESKALIATSAKPVELYIEVLKKSDHQVNIKYLDENGVKQIVHAFEDFELILNMSEGQEYYINAQSNGRMNIKILKDNIIQFQESCLAESCEYGFGGNL